MNAQKYICVDAKANMTRMYENAQDVYGQPAATAIASNP